MTETAEQQELRFHRRAIREADERVRAAEDHFDYIAGRAYDEAFRACERARLEAFLARQEQAYALGWYDLDEDGLDALLVDLDEDNPMREVALEIKPRQTA